MSKRRRKPLRYLLPQIIERDGGEWVCHYCGHKLVPEYAQMGHPDFYYQAGFWENGDPSFAMKKEYRYPVVDHKQPYSKGGSDHIDNLLAACWECNAARAAKPYEVFIRNFKS